MSKLTIRTPQDANLDICDSEWSVYQDDGTWFRIDPLNDLRVRHGSNEYWLTIECDSGVDYCPPEDMSDCWPGYTGDFDSGEFKTGGPTGYLVSTCDGTNPKTYTGHTPDFNVAGGRFFASAPVLPNSVASALPVTLFGETAEINEMLVWAGSASGAVEVSVNELDPGVRVRIYHGCKLLGDSKLSGNYFNIFYDASPPELRVVDCGVPRPANNFITVRVDAPAGARWRVKLGEVDVLQLSHYDRPAPCFGTFGPTLPCRVNEDHRIVPGVTSYEMIHRAPDFGRMHIDLTVQGKEPVVISVFYNGTMLAQGASLNSPEVPHSAISLPFSYNSVGGDEFIVVRYDAPRNYNKWQYSIYCAEQRGSRVFPMTCMPAPDDFLCLPLSESLDPAYAIIGQGAQYNDMYFDYSEKTEGDIAVEFFAEDPVQIIFYQGTYPNDIVVGGTNGFVSGHQRFYFEFYPRNGTVIHARILGPCCPSWAFTVSCPIPFAKLIIDDAEKVRLKKGEVNYLCFHAYLSHPTPREVNFSYKTTPLDAVEAASNCVIPSIKEPSPYCDIPADTGVQISDSYNDTNIGYDAQRICSQAHTPNCAVGGQYFVMETEITLPYDGTYTWVGTGDDNCFIYLDCELKVSKTTKWETVQTTNFVAKAGLQTLSIMYQNVQNCTPAWVKCVIVGGMEVVFSTNAMAYTWRSKTSGISIEPPPEPVDYDADYNKTQSVGLIPACSVEGVEICVPICGTDLMGPDVQFKIDIFNLTGVKAERPFAIGTIINENYYECPQDTEETVNDGGLCEFVNRNARRMYVQATLKSNGAASYVMDMPITFPQSGVYTFIFFGKDVAELYMDCNMIAESKGTITNKATRVRTVMNRGDHHMYINYKTNDSKVRRNGYASLCILDPFNQIMYTSNAVDWRGRIIDAGKDPSCIQFGGKCEFLPNGSGVVRSVHEGASANFTVGYGAQMIRSDLHASVPAANSKWTVQFRAQLPAGRYTMLYSAANRSKLYINCNIVNIKDTDWRDINSVSFNVGAGQGNVLFNLMYQSLSGPSWVCFAILNSAGEPVLVSSPTVEGIRSAAEDSADSVAGGRLYETRLGSTYVQHISGSAYYGGPHYAWYIAEQVIDIPESGEYFISAGQDAETIVIYVNCEAVVANRSLGYFYMSAGLNRFLVRKYNARADKQDWWYFKVYNKDGQIVYTSRAAGWKARRGDADFSGLA